MATMEGATATGSSSSGKGDQDRVALPPSAIRPLSPSHLERVRRRHEADLLSEACWVALPEALDRKYPNAGREWPWQCVLPGAVILPVILKDADVPPLLRQYQWIDLRGGNVEKGVSQLVEAIHHWSAKRSA